MIPFNVYTKEWKKTLDDFQLLNKWLECAMNTER